MTPTQEISKLSEENAALIKKSVKYLKPYKIYCELWEQIRLNQLQIKLLKRKHNIGNTMRPYDDALIDFYRAESKAMAL